MAKDGVSIQGFSRVTIEDGDGTLKGDSGWCGPNTITNVGKLLYLCDNIGKSASSLQIAAVALGSGGTIATNATALASEIYSQTLGDKRKAPTYADVDSRTAQFLATFGSSDSIASTTVNISNIGLFAATGSVASGNTVFAGNTYASSGCATNQNVNVTYQIRFT
jgi:hypothetical protein